MLLRVNACCGLCQWVGVCVRACVCTNMCVCVCVCVRVYVCSNVLVQKCLYVHTLRRKILLFIVNIISLEPSTTRLPYIEPYNTLTITCTASSSSTSAKTFRWIHQNRGSLIYDELAPNSRTVWIENSNLEQHVSTSVLTVKVSGYYYTTVYHNYLCRVEITDLGVFDSNVVEIEVTSESYGYECVSIIISRGFNTVYEVKFGI